MEIKGDIPNLCYFLNLHGYAGFYFINFNVKSPLPEILTDSGTA